MKNVSQITVLFLLSLLSGSLLQAQQQTPGPSLTLISQYQDGAVWLRWAPPSASIWERGNQYGYEVYRQEIAEGKTFDPSAFRLLTPQAIRPVSLEAMKAQVDQRSDYLLVAGECLYGERMTAPNLLSGLEAADELQNRFNLLLFAAEMDFAVAQDVALGFRDETVEAGKNYVYRVRLKGSEETSMIAGYTRQLCRDQATFTPQIGQISEEEGRVVLHWSQSLHEPHFSAYQIEQSADGVHFIAVNEAPFVYGKSDAERLQTKLISFPMEVRNYLPLYYRIRGINAFGQLSPPSEARIAMGRDRTPPASPVGLKTEVDEENRIQLTWEMEAPSADLASFRILRSFDYQGMAQELTHEMPADSRSFTDMVPNFVGINYYQVIAIDTAGNEAPSAKVVGFVEDHEAPSAPSGLQGFIEDSTGILQLHWAQNPEPDVAGYRVFFANSLQETFVSKTNLLIADTSFQDTLALRTLSRRIYFRVVAIDKRGNLSDFSQPVAVKRPDVIPPAPALFQDWELKPQAIQLRWIPSSSEDVAVQEVWRKSAEADWKIVASLQPETRSWQDQQVAAAQRYSYRVLTRDSAGLEANSRVLSLQARPAQIDFSDRISLKPTPNQDAFWLLWEKGNVPVKRWIVYRAEGEGPLTSYRSVLASEDSFKDQQVKKGVSYRYALRAVYADGRKSPLSEKVMGTLL